MENNVIEKQAEAYLEGQEAQESQRFHCEKEIVANLEDGQVIAYVDGSNKGDGSAFS